MRRLSAPAAEKHPLHNCFITFRDAMHNIQAACTCKRLFRWPAEAVCCFSPFLIMIEKIRQNLFDRTERSPHVLPHGAELQHLLAE